MSSPSLHIGIIGIGGRMGREIVNAASLDPTVEVVGGTVRPGSGVTVDGIPTYDDLTRLVPEVDVLIDFTTPETTIATVEQAVVSGIPLVIGTTGLSEAQLAVVRDAATTIPVFYARSMAHGINALLRALPAIAQALTGYDIEIVEMHHRHKKDAPSGTALALIEAVASGLASDPALPTNHTYGRSGYAPRQSGEIGFHSLRGGGNTGEHTIVFASDGEEVRISHRALNRGAFAAGAVRAAREIAGKAPGWYGPPL
ncbi:MAG TPA: 4-hydroxy-tetrahydrodipicolinate reductase [Thermomicrobiales bacterium]|nr:4-hydroxy-tetrahydrodipicolinate reductase [Thermomicrobiales bacterium]